MGGGVGVAVGTGAGAGEPAAPGVVEAVGEGGALAGGLVAAGAGGLTCVRAIPTDARTHPALTTAAKILARSVKR